MGGKKSRDKGARFERFLVGVLKTCFPDAHRGQQAHNPRHCDVEGTPFRLEAKNWARLSYKNVVDAVEQAENNGNEFGDERVPMAVTKVTGGDTFVHFRLAGLVQLVEKHFYSPPELADVIPIKGTKDE